MSAPTVKVRVWIDGGGYEDRDFAATYGEDDIGMIGLLPDYNEGYTFRKQVGPGPEWHAWRIRL